jgi:hypothetical protein
MANVRDIREYVFIKNETIRAISSNNSEKNKKSANLLPRFIPNIMREAPNITINPKILIVPTIAVSIILLSKLDFIHDNMIPNNAENIENNINFSTDGIGSAAIIMIIANCANTIK